MSKVHALAASLLVTAFAVHAQAPAPMVRVRGVIEKVDANSLTVKNRSGEVVTLVRPADMNVSEVVPIPMTDIKLNSFVGVGATPQSDGTQRAVEVLVFPEAARGTGEGFRPWDYMPGGTMTNATVATLAEAPSSTAGGQKMVLKYKDGEQTIIVPPGTPIITFKPGNADQAALVVPGAKVTITAQTKDGKPIAMRMLVGRNGFTPPL
jgi:hypothetical protein